MPRLVNRNTQIPGGFRYIQPQTNWHSRPWSSFNSIVDALVAHRKGNPFLVQKHGWSIDKPTVENEVDLYNAMLCKQMGWSAYFVEDGEPNPPKISAPASLANRVGKLAVGAVTQVEWIASGAEAVSPEQSERRAKHCLICPKHGKGDWTSYFTVPAQMAIQKALNQKREWKLETSVDKELQVCEACLCPMRLKVHMPIAAILRNMPEESLQDLDPHCWILSEKKAE